MRKPRVFIPHEPQRMNGSGTMKAMYDLTPALKFGTLETLLPPGPITLSTEAVTDLLKNRLADYTEEDYIMCIGDPVAIGAAAFIAGMVNNGAVTLLRYSRETHQYQPFTYRS